MHRLFVVAVAILAIGCSSRTSVPAPATISPNIYQKQPLPKDGWTTTIGMGGAYGLASDGKHKVWLADIRGAVSEIAMDLHVKNFPLTVEARYVAYGPDKNIWVSTPVGVIARVTRDGAATYYPVASQGMNLENITVGPDGALWFAECKLDRKSGGAGTITTSGTYTFFSSGCEDGIAFPPDGNVWLATPNLLTIMTLQGVVLGQFGGYNSTSVRSMLVGSDGAVYITGDLASGGFLLERVTMTHQFTKVEYRSDDSLEYMANGPGGDLWLSGVHLGVEPILVAFDPITQKFVKRMKAPAVGLIAAGPDDNIWLADQKLSVYTYVRQVMTLSPRPVIVAVGHDADLAVSETHYLGMWTAVSSKPTIASVAPTEHFDPIVVTGVAVGSTRVTVFDSDFNSIDVKVIVTP